MRLQVELDKGFLQRMRATPRKAVSELIWNALDADADVVTVVIDRRELDGVGAVRVIDDGHGMTLDDASDAFARLGGSWKGTAPASRGKSRTLHGREGRGRFFAASLAGHARWETVVQVDGEKRLTVIDIRRSAIDAVEIEDRGITDRDIGTTVILGDFAEPPVGLIGDRVADGFLGEFALYLTKYAIELTYDGTPIDPKVLQVGSATYSFPVLGHEPAELDVVEWKRDVGRRLFLCDPGGTALGDLAPGVQAPGVDFTAYVRWAGFANDSALDLAELGAGSTAEVVEGARDRLREHFKQRAKDRQREIIEAWKRDKIYPYDAPPSDEVDQTSRDLFDVVAITARDSLGTDNRTQRLTLRLLREALEQDPGHLRRVLEDILELDPQTLADLDALLNRTDLAAVVALARSVTDRLDFVRALEEMVFEPEVKGRVLERSQLHRMLASETWVFGEEFNLLVDDEGLTNVLRRHLDYLERADLAPEPVTDEQGRPRIVDLMLGKSMEEAHNRREHLVLELKAPGVKVGHKEAAQIRDYAQAIASDSQFDKATTRWEFWVVSTEMHDVIHQQANQRHRPAGVLDDYEALNVRIWARTWGEIIGDVRHRLKFVRGQLDYSSGRDEALEYLHRRHADFVPEPLKQDERLGDG